VDKLGEFAAEDINLFAFFNLFLWRFCEIPEQPSGARLNMEAEIIYTASAV
jgi:hypothetical protein